MPTLKWRPPVACLVETITESNGWLQAGRCLAAVEYSMRCRSAPLPKGPGVSCATVAIRPYNPSPYYARPTPLHTPCISSLFRLRFRRLPSPRPSVEARGPLASLKSVEVHVGVNVGPCCCENMTHHRFCLEHMLIVCLQFMRDVTREIDQGGPETRRHQHELFMDAVFPRHPVAPFRRAEQERRRGR